MNRRLIRPTLSEVQDQMGARLPRKKPAPAEQTNAENFYYLKQMQARTPMVVVLSGEEVIHGVIEWYDKNCIKVHRANEPNLLIMKSAIRYIYKENENKHGSIGNGNRLPENGQDDLGQG
jgi:sRNA-binding regulator protein Hfq